MKLDAQDKRILAVIGDYENVEFDEARSLYYQHLKTTLILPCEVTGIEDITSNSALTELSVYPNPVKNSATLRFNLIKPEKLNIEVINSIGKSLGNINDNYNQGENEISLDSFITNLSNGIYFVKITSSNYIISKRFVKQ